LTIAVHGSPLRRFAIAFSASRSLSTSRVYRITSSAVLWPVIDMISRSVAPSSASSREAALRSPCAAQRAGKPAASQQSEPSSEARWRERAALRRDKKVEVAHRRRVERRLKVGGDRNHDLGAGLFLTQPELAVA
jgi:hypothetical protein